MVLDTLASTSFGAALSAAGSTAGLSIGADERTQGTSIVIVAATVTSGAVFTIDAKGGGDFKGLADKWAPIAEFAITASGSYAIPANVRKRGAWGPDTQLRVTCKKRTDGSYTCSLSKLTKG